MIDVSWFLFVLASLMLISTPGQDMLLVMSRSIAQGPRAGVVTAAGVSFGLVGHTVLATLGLGAILRTSEWLFLGLKLVGAAYLIWLFQRTMFGELGEKNQGLKDLSWREIAVFAPLVVWAFWIGLAPKPYFEILERPAAQIVERVRTGYFAEHKQRNPLAAAPTAGLRTPELPARPAPGY